MNDDFLKIKIGNETLVINNDFKIIGAPDKITKQMQQFVIDNYLNNIKPDSPLSEGFLTGLAEYYKNNNENCEILELKDKAYSDFLKDFNNNSILV